MRLNTHGMPLDSWHLLNQLNLEPIENGLGSALLHFHVLRRLGLILQSYCSDPLFV